MFLLNKIHIKHSVFPNEIINISHEIATSKKQLPTMLRNNIVVSLLLIIGGLTKAYVCYFLFFDQMIALQKL